MDGELTTSRQSCLLQGKSLALGAPYVNLTDGGEQPAAARGRETCSRPVTSPLAAANPRTCERMPHPSGYASLSPVFPRSIKSMRKAMTG